MSFFNHGGLSGGIDGLSIARGLDPGVSSIRKNGRNSAVGQSSEDVWMNGGVWVAPTSAVPMSIVSDSAADAAAGTGARTLTVSGLDANYAVQTETVTMNGLTPVLTVGSYIKIDTVLVATAGTGLVNAGTITITASGGGNTVQGNINPGYGETKIGIYQVPANMTGYLFLLSCGAQNTTNNAATDLSLFIKPFGGAWNLKQIIPFYRDGTTAHQEIMSLCPIVLNEKSIFKGSAIATAGSSDVHLNFGVVLVNNLVYPR
jgi:hypothetical protein